jgi:hypothetical protein
MTHLEQALARIVEEIEQARAAGTAFNALKLAALLQRKDAICAALAAPEQAWSWPVPDAAEAQEVRRRAVA